MVVDIVDEDNFIFKKQSNTRDTYYKKQKYDIQYFKVSDYKYKNHFDWNDNNAIKNALLKPSNKSNDDNKIPNNFLNFEKREILQMQFFQR